MKKRDFADLIDFADDLAGVDIPNDYRTSGQQYHDFRAVFMNSNASALQAKRVLTRIFHWGGLFTPVHQQGDPYATHVRAGAQQLCQQIMMALNTIPQQTEEDDG